MGLVSWSTVLCGHQIHVLAKGLGRGVRTKACGSDGRKYCYVGLQLDSWLTNRKVTEIFWGCQINVLTINYFFFFFFFQMICSYLSSFFLEQEWYSLFVLQDSLSSCNIFLINYHLLSLLYSCWGQILTDVLAKKILTYTEDIHYVCVHVHMYVFYIC